MNARLFKIFVLTLTIFIGVSAAEAQQALYNTNTGTVESPPGTVIGNVIGGVAVSNTGAPLSGPPFNIGQLTGTDGKFYNVAADGTVTQADQADDDDDNDIPIPPFDPGGDGNGNGGGGGGGGAGGGGAGGGGAGGGGAGGGGAGGGGAGGAGGAGGGAGTGATGGGETPKSPDYSQSQAGQGTGKSGFIDAMASVTASTSDQLSTDGQGNRGGAGGTGGAGGAGGGGGGGDGSQNEMIDTFDGWTQLFSGVRKTPEVIDPEKLEKDYPQLITAEGDENPKRPAMGPVFGQKKVLELSTEDVGVDDEILKTSMAVYQPIMRMQRDFLEDERARNSYLDSALTLRGIAIMTMGFLDKTVGAGLTAVQQQADENTVQHLLKQIGWTTSKMANPDRSQVYRDTDEKLEACLEIALTKNNAKEQVKGISRKIVDFKCSKKCGKEPSGSPYRGTLGKEKEKQGNGSYDYCVCCAETKMELNYINDEGKTNKEDGSAKSKNWSLVERAFYGTKLPEGGPLNEGQRLQKSVRIFKQLYGDIMLTPKKPDEKEAQDDKDDPLRYMYMFPKYSIQRTVRALRNGCSSCDAGSCPPGGTKPDNCALPDDFSRELGICDALQLILANWEDINSGKMRGDDVRDWWIEASSGYVLTGRTIKNLLAINGDPTRLVNAPNGRMKRVIDAFCDASAVAAVTRINLRFASQVADHLAMNQQVTSAEKARLLGLINRYSEQLALAQADVGASFEVENLLTGLSIAHDRRQGGFLASVASAATGEVNNGAQRNGMGSYGSFSTFYPNAAGGAAAGGAGNREAPEVDAPFTGLTDRIDQGFNALNGK